MTECNMCDEEILNCANCDVNIMDEADIPDIRCSPEGHFCSLDCSLDFFVIVKNKPMEES